MYPRLSGPYPRSLSSSRGISPRTSETNRSIGQSPDSCGPSKLIAPSSTAHPRNKRWPVGDVETKFRILPCFAKTGARTPLHRRVLHQQDAAGRQVVFQQLPQSELRIFAAVRRLGLQNDLPRIDPVKPHRHLGKKFRLRTILCRNAVCMSDAGSGSRTENGSNVRARRRSTDDSPRLPA